MDDKAEMAKLRAILVCGIVFLMSGCYSWNELRYTLSGRTTEATLEQARIEEFPGRYGRRYEKLVIKYAFDDEGERRRESTRLSPDAASPEGPTITIQYLPGSAGSSRLDGQKNFISVGIFVASLLALAFFVFRMHQAANEEPTWNPRR